MKYIIAGGLIAAGLLAIPSLPASAQGIEIGPGGVRVDPRSPRERDRDEIRREERREEFREERRDAIRGEERRRDFDDDRPRPRDRY
ncbi:hypothetical protein [Methylobacterium longum]|uniref:Uncharacterized protein n=1 Tax=Methylobacterium longum TaxID=767694 RepID=A0ABT8AHN2_9HYPH|nr:hypothetical protein [Methylobacterium longum]MDN3569265.1 hypothetical protein [Methylobacterium longum]GJE14267.1 hypothetical protein FOHLNKBM_5340 [Methylobacterium longum]